MTRIDWLLLKRLGTRIGVAVFVVFGIIFLVENFNTWRIGHLIDAGGPLLGAAGAAVSAAGWSRDVLPITLLIGAIVGLIELRSRQEFAAVSASGISIWRVLRAPLLGVMLFGALLSLVGDSLLIQLNRALSLTFPGSSQGGELWLEQFADGTEYVVTARRPRAGGTILDDVTVFLPEALGGPRIEARRAELVDGAWRLTDATRYSAQEPARAVPEILIPTSSTRSDMGARLASPHDMSLYEILQLGSGRITEAGLRTGINMRVATLVALPLTLAASLLVAFAFTAGYQRTNKYGGTVLYGIVLGFVFYVVTELALRAGYAGVLQPTIAAFGPAFVAMVVGATVLLFREDGRI